MRTALGPSRTATAIVGSIAGEAAQRAGHDTRGGARKRPHPDGSNAGRVRAIELALGILHRPDGRGGVAEQHFAGRGEPLLLRGPTRGYDPQTAADAWAQTTQFLT